MFSKNIPLLILLFITVFIRENSCFGQIKFSKSTYDMGVVTGSPNDFIDITVKNVSNQKVYIFRTDADRKFFIQYSSKTLLPDSSIFIRVAYNPDKKGDFNDQIQIHFSCYSLPQTISISGFVAEIPATASALNCPSFDKHKPNSIPETEYVIKVIDSITRQPLPQSMVKIVANGMLRETLPTSDKGTILKKTTIGYYYFVADKELYYSNDYATYVNSKTKEIRIALLKKELIPIDENTPPDLIQVVNEPYFPIDSTKNQPPIIVEETPVDEKYPDFPLSKFKPNNIVFVIDISSSMKVEGRLDLLKASMIELTKMLRDIDKLTIIAYSNQANIILDTDFVKDKDTIIAIIQSLEAGGVTDGGKGMKLGYEKALEAFIPNGNNQVIMTTDGAFNTGGDNVYTMAQKNTKKGIDMSIVGIKMKEPDKKAMYKIAELGNGAYVEINNFDDTQTVLKTEIKKKSKK